MSDFRKTVREQRVNVFIHLLWVLPLILVSFFLDRFYLFSQMRRAWDCNIPYNLRDYITDIQDIFVT